MPMRFLFLLPLLCCCVRVVGPSQGASNTPTKALAQDCASDAECLSGQCAQNVCCATPCTGVSSCALEGERGRCSPRGFGAPCTATAECAQGTCDPQDHVCCATACEGTCMTCNGVNPGVCEQVADNQDPRRDCAGDCNACVGGQCLPTAVGTNPHGSCETGYACGAAGTCQVQSGAACTMDEACATGHCVGGLCLRITVVDLASAQLNAPLTRVRFAGFDVDDEGTPHVLAVHELENTVVTSLRTTARTMLLSHRNGVWSGPVLQTDVLCTGWETLPQAVAHAGVLPFVALLDAPTRTDQRCISDIRLPGHVRAFWLNQDGTRRWELTLPPPSDGLIRRSGWVRAVYSPRREFVVAYSATTENGRGVYVSRINIDTGAPGTTQRVLDEPSVEGELLVMGESTVLFTATNGRLVAVILPDGSAPAEEEQVNAPCSAGRVVAAATGSSTARAMLQCFQFTNEQRGSTAYQARFDLAAAAGSRLGPLEALPDSNRVLAVGPVELPGAASAYLVASASGWLELVSQSTPATVNRLGDRLSGLDNISDLHVKSGGGSVGAVWVRDTTLGATVDHNTKVETTQLVWAHIQP